MPGIMHMLAAAFAMIWAGRIKLPARAWHGFSDLEICLSDMEI